MIGTILYVGGSVGGDFCVRVQWYLFVCEGCVDGHFSHVTKLHMERKKVRSTYVNVDVHVSL